MHIIPSVATDINTLYESGGHGYVDQFFKLPTKWCILKDVLTYSLRNREETNALLQV